MIDDPLVENFLDTSSFGEEFLEEKPKAPQVPKVITEEQVDERIRLALDAKVCDINRELMTRASQHLRLWLNSKSIVSFAALLPLADNIESLRKSHSGFYISADYKEVEREYRTLRDKVFEQARDRQRAIDSSRHA